MIKAWVGPLQPLSTKIPSGLNSWVHKQTKTLLSQSQHGTLSPSALGFLRLRRNEERLLFRVFPLRDSMAGKKINKNQHLVNSTFFFFCTSLNANEAEALISAVTANKHGALPTLLRKGGGGGGLDERQKNRKINGFFFFLA